MFSTLLKAGLTILASTQTATVSDSEKSFVLPFNLATSLESVVGNGSFIGNRSTDAPYYSSTLMLSPSYELIEHLSVGADISLVYEWTAMVTPCYTASSPRANGAPALDCSDTDDPNGNRFDWTDLRLSILHEKLYEIYDIGFSGGAGVSLPTSRASRGANNILSLDLHASSSRKVGPVFLKLNLAGDKFFPQAKASSLDAEAIQSNGVPIGHCPSYRQTNCLLLSGFVPSWRFSTGFDLSVEIPKVEGFSAGIGLAYAYSVSHSQLPDQYSSVATDNSGQVIVDGVNDSDTTSAYFELGYEIQKSWAVAAGVSSGQPARTEDGKNIRFPFYDFISPANNYSGFYLSLSHSL